MTATVSVSLNGLTFGDLYDFVALARRAGVPREQEVHQEFDNDGQDGPYTLQVSLANFDALERLALSDGDREQLVEALDAVLATDGDARGALEEIKLIRDTLV